jgi:hypothetical protein
VKSVKVIAPPIANQTAKNSIQLSILGQSLAAYATHQPRSDRPLKSVTFLGQSCNDGIHLSLLIRDINVCIVVWVQVRDVPGAGVGYGMMLTGKSYAKGPSVLHAIYIYMI